MPAKCRIAATEMPASAGEAGPGEMTIAGRDCARDALERDPVIAEDLDLGAELAEVLHDVVVNES